MRYESLNLGKLKKGPKQPSGRTLGFLSPEVDMKLCWVSFKRTLLGLQHIQNSKGSNKTKGSKIKVHFLFTILNWDFVNLLKSFHPQPIFSKINFFTTGNTRTKNLVSNERSWTDLSNYGSFSS